MDDFISFYSLLQLRKNECGLVVIVKRKKTALYTRGLDGVARISNAALILFSRVSDKDWLRVYSCSSL